MKGFTLLELIIVMLIIGITLGLISITLYYKGGPFELNTFVNDVSATLRYARSRAIAEKKVYSFIIRENERAYGLYVGSSNKEVKESSPVIYRTIPEHLETILKNKTDDSKIDFFPQGNSSGGTIEVKNQKGKILLIVVNKVTGSVEVK